jgi:signal transduction histidine kinase
VRITPEGVNFAPDRLLAGRVFSEQKPLLSIDPARDDPRDADFYRALGIGAVLAAPVSSRERHHGVLAVWADRAPVFAEGDLELVQLLALQAATVLESRALLEDAAEARARRAADDLKDEFLASMSHDLRNPLTSVRGVAQILERRLSRDGSVDIARLTTGLRTIGAATEQMNYLIDQILDAARIRGGRPLDLDIRTADLVALAETAITAEQQLSDRHTIRLEAAEPSITAEWDARRLERVVQNLLNNAIKYSPDGGDVLVQVRRELSPAGEWAVLSVRDQGIGIPEHDVAHIFERFHRGGNVPARITGSGIGLATARQVAEQHGGTLSVESREGVGSTFTLRLPIGSLPTHPPTGDGQVSAADSSARHSPQAGATPG